MNRVIDNGEEIIGRADDIIEYVKDNMKKAIDDCDKDAMEMFPFQIELIQDLEEFACFDLVKCQWNEMGAWEAYRLVRDLS